MANQENGTTIRIGAIDAYSNILEQAYQAFAEFGDSVGKTSDRLSRSFKALNIKSSLDIEVEKARLVAAFEAIKKSGVASADEIARAETALKSRLLEIENAATSGGRKITQQNKATAESTGLISTGLAGIAGWLAAAFAFERVVAFTKAAFDASLAVDSINSKLKIVAGSDQGAAEEWQFIRSEAKRLRLDLEKTAESYSSFAIATKGTAMEGEKARAVFIALAESAVAMHLPADKVAAAMYQIQQAMAKGSLQMVDLRPILETGIITFKQLADAMGISTQELVKQMESGQLMTDDVLPKLAKLLHETYGEAAVAAAKKGRGAIADFNSELFQTKSAFGEVLQYWLSKTNGFFSDLARAPRNLKALLEASTIGWISSLERGKILLQAVLSGKGGGSPEIIAKIQGVNQKTEESYDDLLKKYGEYSVSSTKTLGDVRKEHEKEGELRRKNAKKTGEDLTNINLEYAKLSGDAEQQLTADLNKQYEERKKATTAFWNQKKARAKDNHEEFEFEQDKKIKLLELERQHARDIEIVKAQMRVRSLDNLKNEVDMETLLIREKVAKKVITERQGEQQITELTVAAARMQYEAKKSVTDKIIEIYGKDGAEYKKALKDQEAAQKEYLSANLSAYKKYADEIKGLDQEIKNFRMSMDERIREGRQKLMTEDEKYLDNKKRAEEAFAQAQTARAAGDYESAKKLAEEAANLATRLQDKRAKDTTSSAGRIKEVEDQLQKDVLDIQTKRLEKFEIKANESSDRQKAKDFLNSGDKIEAAKRESVQDQVALDIDNKRAEAAKKIAEIRAQDAATHQGVGDAEAMLAKLKEFGVSMREEQKKTAQDALAKLKEIQDMKLDPKNLDVNLNESALARVKETIGALTATETKTIIIKTVGSMGEAKFSNSGSGYFAGGKVLNGSPNYDSVWTNALAGGEWVINNTAAKFWGDDVMAFFNNPISAGASRVRESMKNNNVAANAPNMGTINLQLGDAVYPVQGKIDVLSELSTQLRRRRLSMPQ